MTDFSIAADESFLLLIDMQERFLPAIPDIAPERPIGSTCATLIEGIGLLEVPVTITEQVPAKLGPTLDHLRTLAPEARVHAKSHFSCGDDADLKRALAAYEREVAIVCGIEAHVCVLSTVDDLLRHGYRVVVACDAIASRDDSHRVDAVASMRQLGALCVPCESILFRLQREAGVGCFKALSRLVR